MQIRKPLILPDPVSGLHLELSYEPEERTFSIQSKFDQGTAWSMHVVGSMRGERTEAAFAASTWKRKNAARTEPVKVEDFYRQMSDMGLRYGEEFRPIRELSAGNGESVGRVTLSEAINHRAQRIPIASRSIRWSAANLFRGSRDGGGSQVATETSGALCQNTFLAVPWRFEPGPYNGAAMR